VKRWVHLQYGVIQGIINADGSVGHEELARELGEWVLMGVTPLLFDFGDQPARVGNPLPPAPPPVPAPLTRSVQYEQGCARATAVWQSKPEGADAAWFDHPRNRPLHTDSDDFIRGYDRIVADVMQSGRPSHDPQP
jgi:hypothetical protein